MNDRELLELAAKAAGIEAQYSDNFGDFSIVEPYSMGEQRWNPLTDDGDAFRLAVSLSLVIRHSANRMEAYLMGYPSKKASELFHYDPDRPAHDQPQQQASARRAIVLAASKMASQPLSGK